MGGLWHCFTHIRTITMKPQDWGTTWHYEMKELRPFAGALRPCHSFPRATREARVASAGALRSFLGRPWIFAEDLKDSKGLRKRGHVLSRNFIWVFLLILILRDVYFDDFQPKGMKWIPMVSDGICIILYQWIDVQWYTRSSTKAPAAIWPPENVAGSEGTGGPRPAKTWGRNKTMTHIETKGKNHCSHTCQGGPSVWCLE